MKKRSFHLVIEQYTKVVHSRLVMTICFLFTIAETKSLRELRPNYHAINLV